jgi:flagellar biosynthesis/type III secretory pathway ATPase
MSMRHAFSTGVRAIDGLLNPGAGQRIALLADADAGATRLLASIVRHGSADANVILLTGVGPPELGNFVETRLGEEGMRRSVLVVVFRSEPSVHLAKAAELARHLAEGLCQAGRSVLLVVDSLTLVESGGLNGNCGHLLACAGNRGPAAVTSTPRASTNPSGLILMA